MSFLKRYQDGEHERVWAELLALGNQVRQEPLYLDAMAVAAETMRRARQNIERLVLRLREIGYEFKAENPDNPIYPEAVITSPSPDSQRRLTQIERAAGVLPISLRAWYSIVGSVNLMGTHPGIRLFEDEPLPDPLVVDPINDYHVDLLDDWQVDQDTDSAGEPYLLELAPDEYQKANMSGGVPYSVAIPNDAIDAQLLGEWHGATFVEYLRTCFRWGGFPGFERLTEKDRPTRLLAELTTDLLPL